MPKLIINIFPATFVSGCVCVCVRMCRQSCVVVLVLVVVIFITIAIDHKAKVEMVKFVLK